MKKFICDCDGVVAKFSEPLIQAVESNLTIDDIQDWDWFELLTEEQQKKKERILNSSSFWSNQPVIEGAHEGIEKIRRAGFEVIWCTSPWVSCKEWEYTRRKWLQKNFGAKANQIIMTQRKDIIRGDAFIDDKLSHIDEWSRVPGNEACHGFVFDAPYNQDGGVHKRMFGWKEIDRVIDEVLRGK